MAIKRELSSAKSKRYWAFVDRAADEVSRWPGWMQRIGTGEGAAKRDQRSNERPVHPPESYGKMPQRLNKEDG